MLCKYEPLHFESILTLVQIMLRKVRYISLKINLILEKSQTLLEPRLCSYVVTTLGAMFGVRMKIWIQNNETEFPCHL